jgi:hypothetical protein
MRTPGTPKWPGKPKLSVIAGRLREEAARELADRYAADTTESIRSVAAWFNQTYAVTLSYQLTRRLIQEGGARLRAKGWPNQQRRGTTAPEKAGPSQVVGEPPTGAAEVPHWRD